MLAKSSSYEAWRLPNSISGWSSKSKIVSLSVISSFLVFSSESISGRLDCSSILEKESEFRASLLMFEMCVWYFSEEQEADLIEIADSEH